MDSTCSPGAAGREFRPASPRRCGAETEVAHILVEAVLAHFERNLDGAHVARVLQRLSHREPPEVVALVVVNHASGQSYNAALAVHNIVRRNRMQIESCRVGDQLED